MCIAHAVSRFRISMSIRLLCPRPLRIGSIKRWCASNDACRLSDVCRVHIEYSWRPQLLEARRAGSRRRKGWAAAGPQRPAYSGQGIVSQRAQLVRYVAHRQSPSHMQIILLTTGIKLKLKCKINNRPTLIKRTKDKASDIVQIEVNENVTKTRG